MVKIVAKNVKKYFEKNMKISYNFLQMQPFQECALLFGPRMDWPSNIVVHINGRNEWGGEGFIWPWLASGLPVCLAGQEGDPFVWLNRTKMGSNPNPMQGNLCKEATKYVMKIFIPFDSSFALSNAKMATN